MKTDLLKDELARYELQQLPAYRVEPRSDQSSNSYMHQIVLIYIVNIGIAEFISIRSVLLASIYLLVVLLNLIIHASRTNVSKESRVIGTFALIPLLRVLGSTMLVPQLPEIYWIALVGVPLFLAAKLTARFLGYAVMSLPIAKGQLAGGQALPGQKLRAYAEQTNDPLERSVLLSTSSGRWYLQLLFAFSGIALALIAFQINPTAALGSNDDWVTLAIGVLFVFLFAGITEAFVFYGLIQRVLSEVFTPPVAVLYTTLIVTLMSVHLSSLTYSAFAFVLALLFSLWTQLTRSFWGTALAYGLMTVFLFYCLPMWKI